MRTCGEELRDTGGVEASLGETKGRTQTSTSGTNDDGIVLMVDNRVLAGDEPRSLLCLQVLGSKDAGGGPCRGESARRCADALRKLWRYWLAIAPSTRSGESGCIHTLPSNSLRSLGSIVDIVAECYGMCGTRLGAEDAGFVGARGRWAAQKALDGTHLAGELHATHPGEAHDGGSRGVESGCGVEDLWLCSMCKSMMELALSLTN